MDVLCQHLKEVLSSSGAEVVQEEPGVTDVLRHFRRFRGLLGSFLL